MSACDIHGALHCPDCGYCQVNNEHGAGCEFGPDKIYIETPEGLVLKRHMSGGCPCWELQVDTLHVWIKRYSDKVTDSPFSGYRVGVGASPTDGYNSLDEALQHVARKAQEVASWRIKSQLGSFAAALKSAKEVRLGFSYDDLVEVIRKKAAL